MKLWRMPQLTSQRDARIRFRVTNSRGEGVSAALGLQVVDEAVFALAESNRVLPRSFSILSKRC